jgi:hypothetical protein
MPLIWSRRESGVASRAVKVSFIVSVGAERGTLDICRGVRFEGAEGGSAYLEEVGDD